MHERVGRLRSTYPTWRIWQSDGGRWWAANEAVTWQQLHQGCVATLDADDLDGLAQLLGGQAQMTAEVLAS